MCFVPFAGEEVSGFNIQSPRFCGTLQKYVLAPEECHGGAFWPANSLCAGPAPGVFCSTFAALHHYCYACESLHSAGLSLIHLIASLCFYLKGALGVTMSNIWQKFSSNIFTKVLSNAHFCLVRWWSISHKSSSGNRISCKVFINALVLKFYCFIVVTKTKTFIKYTPENGWKQCVIIDIEMCSVSRQFSVFFFFVFFPVFCN